MHMRQKKDRTQMLPAVNPQWIGISTLMVRWFVGWVVG